MTIIQRARLAIGCRTCDGQEGDFLYAGEKPDSEPPVSPVFPGMVAFIEWRKTSGWEQEGPGLQAGYVRKLTP